VNLSTREEVFTETDVGCSTVHVWATKTGAWTVERAGWFDADAAKGNGWPERTLPPRIGVRRLRHGVRNQVEFRKSSLDDLLPEEHYDTLRGVGSDRELNRRCEQHAAYRRICGGVSMNDHTRADLRTRHVAWLDRLLSESAASLMAEGLVTLDRVVQDGMKVRASADTLRSAASRR